MEQSDRLPNSGRSTPEVSVVKTAVRELATIFAFATGAGHQKLVMQS